MEYRDQVIENICKIAPVNLLEKVFQEKLVEYHSRGDWFPNTQFGYLIAAIRGNEDHSRIAAYLGRLTGEDRQLADQLLQDSYYPEGVENIKSFL